MPFGDVPSLSNYTGRMAEAARYDPNEFNASRENYRQNRYNRASFDALMRRLEPPDMQRQRQRVGRIENRQDELYDLEHYYPREQQVLRREGDLESEAQQRRWFGQSPMRRAQVQEGIDKFYSEAPVRRTQVGERIYEGDRTAEAEQGRFFAQEPMRRAKESEALRALRARYADPAIIAGQAALNRERIRAYGGVAESRVLAGDPLAGPTASQTLTPDDNTMEIEGPEGLRQFAQENNMTLEQAIEMAQQGNFTVTNQGVPLRSGGGRVPFRDAVR